MDILESILEDEFPALNVENASTYGNRVITQDELVQSIKYIRDNRLVQDAIKFLHDTPPLRDSVSYPIIFPNQKQDLYFQVKWVQGPMVTIGTIEIEDRENRIPQARLYGMRTR